MPTVHLTIFQTSDEHGHLGNAGRVARMVDDARKKNPDGVLLVSCGDFFAGSAESDILGPKASQDILNKSGYDLFTDGNHEVDFGADYLRQWVARSKATVVSANVIDGATGKPLPNSQPTCVKTLHGIPLGFFGLTTPDTASLAFPGTMGSLSILPPIPAARQAVTALHSQGARNVFVLSHLGDGDDELASALPDLHILGGHTHTAWDQPKEVNGDPITRPGAFRSSLMRIDLDVDPDTQDIVREKYTLVPLTDDLPTDAAVQRIVDRQHHAMEAQTAQPVGVLSRPLHHDDRASDDFDPLLTGLMCDRSGADVAILNKQFVRQSLTAGPLTEGPVLNAMPFTNRLQTTTVTAAHLCRMHALSESRHDETSLVFGSAGGRYEIRDGHLWDRQTQQVVPGDRKLHVAATDFLVGGGLGYLSPPAHPEAVHDLDAERPMIRQVFMDAVAAGRT